MKIEIIIDEMIRIGKVVINKNDHLWVKPWYERDTVPHSPNGVMSTHTLWTQTDNDKYRGLWYNSSLGQFIEGRLFSLTKQGNSVYIEHNGRLFAAAIREPGKYELGGYFLVSCGRSESGIWHSQALNWQIDAPLMWIKENDSHCELKRLAVACHGLFAAHELELVK